MGFVVGFCVRESVKELGLLIAGLLVMLKNITVEHSSYLLGQLGRRAKHFKSPGNPKSII